MRVTLDCRKMTDKRATHAYLKEALQFPDYYGNNLDALFDVLTDREEPLFVALAYWRQLSELLGAYGISLLETMRQASEENALVEVMLVAEM